MITQSLRSHSWLHPKLKVSSVTNGGSGIFAGGKIEKNTLIAIIGGHVMTIQEEPIFPDGRFDLAMQIHDEFVLGAKFPDEVEDADCFNHSCDPNAGFRGQIFLIAMRDIEADEQVCFDYSMVLNTPYRMECLCGSQKCRGVVTGDDWQLPDLQARYDGWFQWYLQEKINALRGG